MSVTQSRGTFAAPQRRHPRLLQVVTWLRRHPALCGSLGAVAIAVIFLLALRSGSFLLSGFYMLPLIFLAVSLRERPVAFAVVTCLALTAFTLFWNAAVDWQAVFLLAFATVLGGALVALSYLIGRLATMSDYAQLRAQLSEAGADVLGSAHSRSDLDALLDYAVERVGEQLQATSAVLLLYDDGWWLGAAGYGLGVEPRGIVEERERMPLAVEALEAGVPLRADLGGGDPGRLAALAAHVRLDRVLVAPLRALERDIGVLVFNRDRDDGDYGGEQVGLVEQVARYLAVTIDNVRLLDERNRRQRDLEMVRDSSLDFAQSLDLHEVLEAVVRRLVEALAVHACDVYEVDLGGERLRLLVSYDDEAFDQGEWVGREFALDHFATSALAVRTRRPVVVSGPDDPRLNETERELMQRWGHYSQLILPLAVRGEVTTLVELLDDRAGREFSDDEVELARTICRFAALAIEKARLFEEQRQAAERRDRLAQRLQGLLEFSLRLNQRLEFAEPQEVYEEVAQAALELLDVPLAAVVAGSGDYLALRALAVRGDAAGGQRERLEEELLGRYAAASGEPYDAGLAGVALAASPAGGDRGLLFAPLPGEPGPQSAALVVTRDEGGFGEEDELLLATLAAQLAASLHNALAFQREHAIAETFQRALLMAPPAVPGIEVGVCYRAATDAARVGGDFYDIATLGPGRLVVAIGDVCGKGLSAAAQSVVVRYMARAFAAESSPGEALSRLNSAVITQTPDQPFVTMVVAYVDVARHMFEYAVAGHPRPVVLSRHEEFPVPAEGSVPVGIFRGAVYPTNRAVLPEDSCVVLYTDGLIEARRDGELFGEERLRQAVRANALLPAQELAEALLEAVREYAGGVLVDDCAVVVVKLP